MSHDQTRDKDLFWRLYDGYAKGKNAPQGGKDSVFRILFKNAYPDPYDYNQDLLVRLRPLIRDEERHPITIDAHSFDPPNARNRAISFFAQLEMHQFAVHEMITLGQFGTAPTVADIPNNSALPDQGSLPALRLLHGGEIASILLQKSNQAFREKEGLYRQIDATPSLLKRVYAKVSTPPDDLTSITGIVTKKHHFEVVTNGVPLTSIALEIFQNRQILDIIGQTKTPPQHITVVLDPESAESIEKGDVIRLGILEKTNTESTKRSRYNASLVELIMKGNMRSFIEARSSMDPLSIAAMSDDDHGSFIFGRVFEKSPFDDQKTKITLETRKDQFETVLIPTAHATQFDKGDVFIATVNGIDNGLYNINPQHILHITEPFATRILLSLKRDTDPHHPAPNQNPSSFEETRALIP